MVSPVSAGIGRSDDRPTPEPAPPEASTTPAPLRRRVLWERIRTVALATVALLGVGYTLWLGKTFILPVIAGVFLSFLLNPQIRFLARRGVPAPIGTAVVVLAFLGAGTMAIYLLARPASESLQQLPTTLARAETKLGKLLRFARPIAQIDATAAKLDNQPATPGGSSAITVRVAPEPMLRRLSGGVASVIEGVLVAIVLACFLLAGGERFLHKLIEALPTFKDKRRTVQIARDVEAQISRYLFTVTTINIGLGVLTGLALWALGMPNAAVWGGVAALANYVPYIGPIVTALIIGTVAVTTIDDVGRALLMPAASYLLHAIEANFVTPLILGRRFPINPVALLLGLLFWWHLWGVAGAILAVPMLVAIRVCCEHIDPLKPLGSFLAH
jgi:predicted PurR-regulated permease PerM